MSLYCSSGSHLSLGAETRLCIGITWIYQKLSLFNEKPSDHDHNEF